MQEYPKLNGQSGTVLGGTLILCLIMTMAAASFVLTTGFIHSDQQRAYDNRKLMVAGESVTLMAVRYVRNLPPATLFGAGSISNGVYNSITPSFPLYDTLQNAPVRSILGNPWIRACYIKIAVDTVRVMTWAVLRGTNQDTILTTWKITSAVAGGANGMSNLNLTSWKDTLLGY